MHKKHSTPMIPEPQMVKKCRVCGDHSFGYNFNGLTCASCKAFFRRNAFEILPCCPLNGNCISNMTIKTRNFCRKCRLDKCLAIGMKKELVFRKLRDKVCDEKSSMKVVLNINTISLLSNEKTLNLKIYELARLEEIHKAVSVFVDVSAMEVGEEVTDFVQLANLAGSNIRQVIKFCKSIDLFSALNPTSQMTLLKTFYPEKSIIMVASKYNLQKDGWFAIENEHDNKSIFVPMDLLKRWPQSEVYSIIRTFFRCLHMEMENDQVIRDLILVIQLSKPRHNENVKPEYVRYQNVVYLYILRRYLEHKYLDSDRAAHKCSSLMSLLRQIDAIKYEFKKFYAQINIRNSRQTLSQVLAEIYNLL